MSVIDFMHTFFLYILCAGLFSFLKLKTNGTELGKALAWIDG